MYTCKFPLSFIDSRRTSLQVFFRASSQMFTFDLLTNETLHVAWAGGTQPSCNCAETVNNIPLIPQQYHKQYKRIANSSGSAKCHLKVEAWHSEIVLTALSRQINSHLVENGSVGSNSNIPVKAQANEGVKKDCKSVSSENNLTFSA